MDYAVKNEDIKCKMIKTNLERYGVEYGFENEDVKKKIRETNIKRYGVEYISQYKPIKDRVKETCLKTSLKRYGVRSPTQTQEIRIKMSNSQKRSYAEHGAEIQKKRKENSLRKYGVDHHFKDENIRKRIRETNIRRYGCSYGRSLRYVYDGISFDSSWEVAFWIWHKEHGVGITRPHISFEYYVDGKVREYFPDFEVGGTLIELKGDQFFDENGIMQNPYDKKQSVVYAAKQVCMKEHGVVVLRKSDIQLP